MAYKDSLANVDATLSTTDKLLKVSDYKKWLSLIATLLILTAFLILVLFLVKKYVVHEAGNLWDFVARPFKELSARYKTAKLVEETGKRPALNNKSAAEVADIIYNCFHRSYDNENQLYTVLQNRIVNAADWALVKEQFGTRKCPKWGMSTGLGHSGDLEHILSDNLSKRELEKVRYILKSKGITPNF